MASVQRGCKMTREDALYYAEAYERTDGVPAKGLINDIYDDFEEELKKAYIEGSNDCYKAMKDAGKLK